MSGLEIRVRRASFERYSVVPTLNFGLEVEDMGGQRIHALALRSQIRISPSARRYDEKEVARLRELFGESDRWEATMKSFFWADASLVTGIFEGATTLTLSVPLSTDLEVASAKYFGALDGGEAPLQFLFSGTIFRGSGSKMVVEPIPWSLEAAFRLPVSVMRAALDVNFPNMCWVRLSRETLDLLAEYKLEGALPTWDSAVAALLAQKLRVLR